MSFELDKEKFGNYITVLRKKNKMTQKELAEKLFISDKAVSKWERGQSLPDIIMLTPLSEVLGVTVAELLNCGEMEESKDTDSSQVDILLEKAIKLSDAEKETKRKVLQKRFFIFLACLIVGVFGTVLYYGMNCLHCFQGVLIVEILAAVFGAYFMFFVKEYLPTYYDENKISSYSDGIFRLNTPGICYNNKNWHYIVKYVRFTYMMILAALPLFAIVVQWLLNPNTAEKIVIALTIVSCFGFLVPIYLGAIKHNK